MFHPAMVFEKGDIGHKETPSCLVHSTLPAAYPSPRYAHNRSAPVQTIPIPLHQMLCHRPHHPHLNQQMQLTSSCLVPALPAQESAFLGLSWGDQHRPCRAVLPRLSRVVSRSLATPEFNLQSRMDSIRRRHSVRSRGHSESPPPNG